MVQVELVVLVTAVVEMVIVVVLGLLAAKQPKPKPTAFMPSRMPLSTCMPKHLTALSK